jgi:hypothetical protein
MLAGVRVAETLREFNPPATLTTLDSIGRRMTMKGQFSRKSRRLSRALVLLAAVMCTAFALAWPAPGKARLNCGEFFTLTATYTPTFASIDCDTAKSKAHNGALQSLQAAVAGYQCPSECPTLVEDNPPPVVTVSDCFASGTRWNATGTAQGTYHCQ